MSFNVLAVSAHFDDAELGCGGTLAKHARAGDRVHLYVATRSDYADMNKRTVRSADVAAREGRRAAQALGAKLITGDFATFGLRYDDELISTLRKLIEKLRIDTLYLPWTGDAHQDHRALAQAAITAGRHCARMLMYRINYYDTDEAFVPRVYVDTSSAMPAKLRALRCHASEHKRTNGRWLEYVSAEDRNTGIKLGVRFAEAFQPVRYLVA
jgi:LmbE family N-acetylglucosaminyl deacetylase